MKRAERTGVGRPAARASRIACTFLSGIIALIASCWAPRGGRDATAASDLPELASDLLPLKEWFERAHGRPRALALLSPRCGACLAGTVALEQGLLRGAGDDAAIAIVWMDILPADDEAAAPRAMALLDDPRVTHFRDSGQHAGRAWAPLLGLEPAAWDVYLLFDKGATWIDPAPEPSDWFHQLAGARADPRRRRTAETLATALHLAGGASGWLSLPQAPDAARWDVALDAAQSRLEAAGARDGRCSGCRSAHRLSSLSADGWRRLVLRQEGDGHISVSGTRPPDDANARLEICLYVAGMRCPECMLHAGSALLSVTGVEDVEMRLDDGQACALVARSAEVDREDLLAAVRARGFGAEDLLTRRGGPCPGGLSAEACLP